MSSTSCAPSYNPSKSLSDHLLSSHSQSHDKILRDRQRTTNHAFRSISADAPRSNTANDWTAFERGDVPRSQLEACPPHLSHPASSSSSSRGWTTSAYAAWSRTHHAVSTTTATAKEPDGEEEYSTAWSPEIETYRAGAASPVLSTRAGSPSFVLRGASYDLGSTTVLSRSASSRSSGSIYPLSPHRSPWSDVGGSTSTSTSATSGWATPTVEDVEAVVWTKSDDQGRLSLSIVDEAGRRAREWVGQYGETRGRSPAPAPHPITLTPNNDAEWDFERLFGQARFSPASDSVVGLGPAGEGRPSLAKQRGSSRLREEVGISATAIEEEGQGRSKVVYEAMKETAMRRLAAVQAHFGYGEQT